MNVIPVMVNCPNCSSAIFYVPNTNSITCTNCSEVIDVEIAVIQEVIEEPEETAQPTELDIIGQQLVEKDLQILDLQQENQVLGQQLVDIDLRLLMGGM